MPSPITPPTNSRGSISRKSCGYSRCARSARGGDSRATPGPAAHAALPPSQSSPRAHAARQARRHRPRRPAPPLADSRRPRLASARVVLLRVGVPRAGGVRASPVARPAQARARPLRQPMDWDRRAPRRPLELRRHAHQSAAGGDRRAGRRCGSPSRRPRRVDDPHRGILARASAAPPPALVHASIPLAALRLSSARARQARRREPLDIARADRPRSAAMGRLRPLVRREPAARALCCPRILGCPHGWRRRRRVAGECPPDFHPISTRSPPELLPISTRSPPDLHPSSA